MLLVRKKRYEISLIRMFPTNKESVGVNRRGLEDEEIKLLVEDDFDSYPPQLQMSLRHD